MKWSNGTALTGADVAYSINLAMKNAADPYSTNVATVASATASGNTVTVTFKGTPGYTEFTDYLWRAPVLPEAVWSKLPASQIATYANTHPVGTGPMTLDTYNAQEVAYQTQPNWWATSALGLSFKFKYLVDVVNGSNDQELGQLTAGDIDWSNNFLPGINQLMSAVGGNSGYTLKTFYSSTPYMLSANTVWLEPNDSVAPMSNVNFRKAMAYALNPAAIAQTVYGGIAAPANPTGLLPGLSSFVNQGVVSADAPTYNTAKAKQYLAAVRLSRPVHHPAGAGRLVGLDGRHHRHQGRAPGGRHQRLRHLPAGQHAPRERGRRDLRPAARQQRRCRLHAVELLPAGVRAADRQGPGLPAQLGADQLAQADWSLVQQAATVPLTDTAKLDSIYTQLETDFFAQEPMIPLWYNGAWFQGNTSVWSDYPASTGVRPEHAGHVGRLPRRDDHGLRAGRSAADAGGRELTLAARQPINHTRGSVNDPPPDRTRPGGGSRDR